MQSVSMLQSSEDHISFRIQNVQIQEGGVDCCLFAIAFTSEYCFKNNPQVTMHDINFTYTMYV